eukprot:1159084-Pelagomonas_calceolata.AAC.1
MPCRPSKEKDESKKDMLFVLEGGATSRHLPFNSLLQGGIVTKWQQASQSKHIHSVPKKGALPFPLHLSPCSTVPFLSCCFGTPPPPLTHTYTHLCLPPPLCPSSPLASKSPTALTRAPCCCCCCCHCCVAAAAVHCAVQSCPGLPAWAVEHWRQRPWASPATNPRSRWSEANLEKVINYFYLPAWAVEHWRQ